MSTNNAAHSPKICFENVAKNGAMVSGDLCVVDNGWNGERFLSHISDAHPDFVAHIVAWFNVANLTGLTPRQLAEQRAELLEALEDLVSLADSCMKECGEYDRDAELREARAAIAKCGVKS